MNIKRLMDIGCYRGLRHRRSLPVRGQRTRTNARTRKGPRKGAVAGRRRRCRRMAKTEPDGAEKKEAGKPKKTFKKRGEKRVVHHGLVHSAGVVQQHHHHDRRRRGQRVAWSSAGAVGFKGSRKGTPFAATQAALAAANAAKGMGMRVVRRAREGPRRGPRVGHPRAQTVGHRGEVDPRRHADSAQRLPAAEAPARVATTDL